MSRAGGSKAKVEKSSKTGNASSTINTPVAHYDIVPGTSFTDQDWCQFTEKESDVDFIKDIVDEIITHVDKAVYDCYIEKNVIPYTVAEAREELIQLFEWLTLARDEGSPGVGYFKDLIDCEPQPAITDCLAQGSVPTVLVTTRNSELIVEESDNQLSEEQKDEGGQSNPQSPKEIGTNIDEFANSSSQIISNEPITLEVANVIEKATEFTLPDIPTNIAFGENEDETEMTRDETDDRDRDETDDRDRDETHETAQPTNADGIDDQPDILNASTSVIPDDVKIHQANCEMQQMHGVQMFAGDVPQSVNQGPQNLKMKKIPLHKLPADRVDTVYCIVSPPDKPKTNQRTRHMSYSASKKLENLGFVSREIPPPAPAQVPPALIDTISLTEGVTVRQLSRIKRVPRKHASKIDANGDTGQLGGLQTIKGFSNCDVNVSDLFESQIRVIKPLGYQSPIPPIGITNNTVMSQ